MCNSNLSLSSKLEIGLFSSLNFHFLKSLVFDKIVDKACLCEDLAAPALIDYNIENKRPLKSTVCAGPNIAYYKKIVTLKEMVSHIYGSINLIDDQKRPSLFVSELNISNKIF